MRILAAICALALAGAGVVSASGCGASDTVDPAVVAKAAERTANAGVARMDIAVKVRGQTLHGQGALDPKTGRGQVTLALPNSQGEVETRYIGTELYLRLPKEVAKGLPDGKSWAKIDYARLLKSKGLDAAKAQSPSGNNPDQTLEQLRGAGDVERVGSEKLRGDRTTHYKATIDLRKAAERLAADDKAKARQGMSDIIKASGGKATVPMEVWIDDQGRVRRMHMEQRLNGQDLDQTMELYDFGGNEAIVAPPGGDTADITDQTIKQLGG